MKFYDIISPYIVVIVISWTISHIIKYFIQYLKNGKFDPISNIFSSGGMPSSHSATIVSLTTLIGLIDGFGSAIFGLSALMSIIVMYDATKVRRSTGEQGDAIHHIIDTMKISYKHPYTAKGHKPIEVIMGLLLGILIGYIVFLTTF